MYIIYDNNNHELITNKDELFGYITNYIEEYDCINTFNVDVEEPANKPKCKKSPEYNIWTKSDEAKKYRKDIQSKRNPNTKEIALSSKEQALINRLGFNNHGSEIVSKRIEENLPSGFLGINVGPNKETKN